MKIFVNILIILFLSACSKQEKTIYSDFPIKVELKVNDSLNLERLGILNPHNIQFKDSFLILCSMSGNKDIVFWNLRSNHVITRNVIGQGSDEMPQYSIVRTADSNSFRFANHRQGQIYEMDLEKLRRDSTAKHSLVYNLPVKKGDFPLRFIDAESFVFGIGIFEEGRIYSFDKKTNQSITCMDYPLNEDIEKIDQIHRGALFTGTVMVNNNKTLVLSCFGLIDFYEIMPNGDLTLKCKHHYSFPKFKTMEVGKIITFNRDDIHGVSDIDADNHFVYLLYSGKNVKEKEEDAYNCSNLLVYDWNGNPIAHCTLSKSLYSFSIDGNKLYGLSRESIPITYIYSLEDVLNINK